MFRQDPRFNSAIDMRTGYKTTLILSMPICNYEGDVIGVAQIINKTNGSNEFTDRDVEVFQRYVYIRALCVKDKYRKREKALWGRNDRSFVYRAYCVRERISEK